MATPKPMMLGSNFLRAVRSCRPQTYQSLRAPPIESMKKAHLHSTRKNFQQETGYQRYGPAASADLPPPPKPAQPYLPSTDQTKTDASEPENKEAASKERAASDKDAEKATEEHEEEMKKASDVQQQPNIESNPTESKQEQNPEVTEPLQNKELDMVLSLPSPSEVKGGEHRHPHINTPPYEHHFDTYTLVQDLTQSAFTEKQAVTLMKAIRGMLAENLEVAKEGLVSKSDTENESYLFRAACSELKTTMETSRFMEAQKQRSQRAQVQHEFDILNQKVSQDVASMREELKGMFNDRKLGLQEEKRKVDGHIQELSYRISVDLNSEAKSEVEGLRWVLTRRAALAIGAAATMTLAFLQYYSVKNREQAEIEKKRKAAKKAQEERMAQEQARFTTPSRSSGTQTEDAGLGRNYEESLG